MERSRGRNIFYHLAVIEIGVFFGWIGIDKLRHLAAFTDTVGNYQLVSRPWDAVIAYSVPWLEMVAALALVLGFWKRGGLLILASLLVVFSAGIAWVWSQGLNINCGCFGVSEEPTNYPLHLALNAYLFFKILMLLILDPRPGWHLFRRTRPEVEVDEANPVSGSAA